jgi:hypothetical protein
MRQPAQLCAYAPNAFDQHMAGSVEIGPFRQRQQSDLGDRLGIYLLVLVFDDLDDPTPLGDDSAYSVTAQRANEGIRDAEAEASAIDDNVQSLLNEQHVEIELPPARRLESPSICCHLFWLASVQLAQADKRWAANDRIDAAMRQIVLNVQETPANYVRSQVWWNTRTLPPVPEIDNRRFPHGEQQKPDRPSYCPLVNVDAKEHSAQHIETLLEPRVHRIIRVASVIVQPPKHVS